MASFPQELFDIIIDCLQDDRCSLVACCLVCAAWVERCRKALYQRINLYSRSDLQLLVRTCRMAHMEHHLLTLRELGLFGHGLLEPAPANPESASAPTEGEYIYRASFQIPAKFLANVERLEIRAARWSMLPSANRPSISFAVFSSVTTLLLSQCRFETFGEFRETLTAFPRLSHLNLQNLWVDTVTPPPFGHSPGHSIRLESLQIDSGCSEELCSALFRSFLRSETRRSLSRFSVKGSDKRSPSSLPSFLRILGSSLLRLDVPLSYVQGLCREAMFSQLAAVGLSGVHISGASPIVDFLSLISSNTLVVLNLSLQLELADDGIEVLVGEWWELDDLLSSDPRFCNLRMAHVEFALPYLGKQHLGSSSKDGQLEEAIAQRLSVAFSHCQSRGILHVTGNVVLKKRRLSAAANPAIASRNPN
ncbi:uncharacterized protein LAESUDRAFT_816840 [Laetiporus sulphureus 93-53]|uniref:F-box domain-containing protein n=1 Tax=Laetiporus sulphureus 93-53 TaxID=1314785 RepID=A0A165AWX3_9APHY|nr:uncharacterized protein LAESUDRAFT_816840 [Laetiporus sulphureus 93-53]KZS99809.1 hypothetical protein LAESUDRAFT_816840 [Laetiporus sulphureus 93-53]